MVFTALNPAPANQLAKLEQQRPLRILHVFGSMNRGGSETWMMSVFRKIDRSRFQMDFLVNNQAPGDYDAEIHSLGSQVIRCSMANPFGYVANLYRIVRDYDIVHSHIHHFSGLVLTVAKLAGVKIRIAHSHTNSAALEANAGLARRFYLDLMKRWIKQSNTIGLAPSEQAAVDLFGTNWAKDPRYRILSCGIDLTPFDEWVDRVAIRAELGIGADDFVIGHIGRFDLQKNHRFLLKIFAEFVNQKPNARLLLVGRGALESQIQAQAIELGLSDRIVFAGVRADIPRLMLGAMDVFLFPSLCEGLGLVLIEAQAAGLPCIFSDLIPPEVDLVPRLMARVSLSSAPSVWVSEILKMSNDYCPRATARMMVENSLFNVKVTLKTLENLFRQPS